MALGLGSERLPFGSEATRMEGGNWGGAESTSPPGSPGRPLCATSPPRGPSRITGLVTLYAGSCKHGGLSNPAAHWLWGLFRLSQAWPGPAVTASSLIPRGIRLLPRSEHLAQTSPYPPAHPGQDRAGGSFWLSQASSQLKDNGHRPILSSLVS